MYHLTVKSWSVIYNVLFYMKHEYFNILVQGQVSIVHSIRVTCKEYDFDWKCTILKLKVFGHFAERIRSFNLKQHDHFAELKRSSSHSKMMYGNDHPQMKVYDQKSFRLFGSEWWVFADDRIFSINDLVLSFEDGRFRTRIISERISSVMIAYFKPGSNSVRIVYLSKIVYLTWSYA